MPLYVIARYILAITLGFVGMSKVLDSVFQVSSPIQPVAQWVLVLVGFLELYLSWALFRHPRTRQTYTLISLLLVCFSVYFAYSYFQPVLQACNCFGLLDVSLATKAVVLVGMWSLFGICYFGMPSEGLGADQGVLQKDCRSGQIGQSLHIPWLFIAYSIAHTFCFATEQGRTVLGIAVRSPIVFECSQGTCRELNVSLIRGETNRVQVRIRNRSGSIVKLTATSSCSCVSTGWNVLAVQPGEAVSADFDVRAPGVESKDSKVNAVLRFYSDSSQKPMILLPVYGTVI